jgi:hypothetical protein
VEIENNFPLNNVVWYNPLLKIFESGKRKGVLGSLFVTAPMCLAFSMNEKLKLPVVCGSLRLGFLLLLRRSRFVGKEIQL